MQTKIRNAKTVAPHAKVVFCSAPDVIHDARIRMQVNFSASARET